MFENCHAEPREHASPAARVADGPDAVAASARAARQEADRISFSDLGRRREELARALPEGGDLASALAADATYQALLERRDALRRRQAELEGLAEDRGTEGGATPALGAPPVSDSDAPVPGSGQGKRTAHGVPRRRRRVATRWVTPALHLVIGIAATAAFADFVQETEVAAASRDVEPPAPKPDVHEYTCVWLHPVLLDAMNDPKHAHVLGDARQLRDFLAERGLSPTGGRPLVRIEAVSAFHDPDMQARYGLRYSFSPSPEHAVDVLVDLCTAKEGAGPSSALGDVPVHRMDTASRPEPMDATTVLEREYRRQAGPDAIDG